jgi:hypothetical protein
MKSGRRTDSREVWLCARGQGWRCARRPPVWRGCGHLCRPGAYIRGILRACPVPLRSAQTPWLAADPSVVRRPPTNARAGGQAADLAAGFVRGSGQSPREQSSCEFCIAIVIRTVRAALDSKPTKVVCPRDNDDRILRRRGWLYSASLGAGASPASFTTGSATRRMEAYRARRTNPVNPAIIAVSRNQLAIVRLVASTAPKWRVTKYSR